VSLVSEAEQDPSVFEGVFVCRSLLLFAVVELTAPIERKQKQQKHQRMGVQKKGGGCRGEVETREKKRLLLEGERGIL
jgi:hypothetical protein